MAWQIALILLSVALLVAVMATVRHLGRAHDWPAELQRKSVHVATGAYALTLPWLFTDRWPVLVIAGGAVLILLLLRMPVLAKSGLGATLHSVERHSYGDILLALSVGIVFYFAHGNPVLYVLPIAIVTLSDAAAALTGVHYGRKFFNVETGTKSLEGSATFFMVTWIVAMILLLLMTEIERANVVLLSLVVAAFGTLMEADSWHGFDNLFLPVGLHLFLAGHLETPPLSLLGLTTFFLAVLVGVLAFAPRLGLSGHAARAYTIGIFMICAVTELHNAALPILALMAHLVVRNVRPSRSAYADLDALALIMVIAVLWLFIGRYAEQNALNMYNLTFAGVALVFLTLAARERPTIIAGGATGLFAVVMVIATWNPPDAQWHGLLSPWIALSFALCLSVPALRPELLDRYRGPRTLALALPVPLAVFLTRAFFP
jgi:phytol kinase